MTTYDLNQYLYNTFFVCVQIKQYQSESALPSRPACCTKCRSAGIWEARPPGAGAMAMQQVARLALAWLLARSPSVHLFNVFPYTICI